MILKYISSLYSAIDECREYTEKHPSKEIVLLKALKCYGTGTSSKHIDNIINTLTVFNKSGNIEYERGL